MLSGREIENKNLQSALCALTETMFFSLLFKRWHPEDVHGGSEDEYLLKITRFNLGNGTLELDEKIPLLYLYLSF